MKFRRQVSFEEGSAFQDKHKIHLFYETSSKSGFNINEVFMQIF